MNRSVSNLVRFLSMLSLVLVIQTRALPTEAHDPNTVPLSGFGSATIDGVLSPGEWDTAATVNFNLVSLFETHPATLHVMNGTTHLFLALVIRNDDFKPSSLGVQGDVQTIFFDNDHDGGIAFSNSEQGDDFMQTQIGFLSLNLDKFGCLPPVCAFPTFAKDVDFGGSAGAVAAISHTPPVDSFMVSWQ